MVPPSVFIELTEVLACPACARVEEAGRPPPQGLVAWVDRVEGRRVLAGHLGCPRCEARYPIREGVVGFTVEEPGAVGGPVGREAPPPERIDPDEAGLVVPALLGLQEDVSGYILLGPGLWRAASRIATAVEGVEVVALVGPYEPEAPDASSDPAGGEAGEPDPGKRRGSVLRVPDPGRLPLFSGRFRGVALVGGTGATVREAARLLARLGRLAVLAPSEEARETVEAGPLDVLASDPRALVAVRR